MTFRIYSSEYGTICEKKHADQLLEEYPCLIDYNYEIKEEIVPDGGMWIRDENLERIWQPSDKTRTNYIPHITIDTLEQLVDLYKALDIVLIVSDDSIEIYDTWRE